jgi:hypothetical protein
MTMDMMNATIRCSSTLDSPPGLMFTWETSKWLFEDPAGDYASDIELFGMPEILGAGSNILAMFVVWAVVGRLDEYQTNARRCLQYMLLYLLMHGAIHASWGYVFRVPFTAAMNIAFVWMRHHGFTVSWLRASPEKAAKARRISEGMAYLMVLLNLVAVGPRALTIGVTAFVQPLLLWPLRFWADDWRRPNHLAWLVGFSAMWWTFSFFVKKEVQAGSSCTWQNTHLTAESFGIAGNLCLVVYILKASKDGAAANLKSA